MEVPLHQRRQSITSRLRKGLPKSPIKFAKVIGNLLSKASSKKLEGFQQLKTSVNNKNAECQKGSSSPAMTKTHKSIIIAVGNVVNILRATLVNKYQKSAYARLKKKASC